MKITKRQLKRIIREESSNLSEQNRDMGPGSMTPMTEIVNRLKDALIAVGLQQILNHTSTARFENDVIGFVMDTSTSDEGEVEMAIEELGKQLNLI